MAQRSKGLAEASHPSRSKPPRSDAPGVGEEFERSLKDAQDSLSPQAASALGPEQAQAQPQALKRRESDEVCEGEETKATGPDSGDDVEVVASLPAAQPEAMRDLVPPAGTEVAQGSMATPAPTSGAAPSAVSLPGEAASVSSAAQPTPASPIGADSAPAAASDEGASEPPRPDSRAAEPIGHGGDGDEPDGDPSRPQASRSNDPVKRDAASSTKQASGQDASRAGDRSQSDATTSTQPTPSSQPAAPAVERARQVQASIDADRTGGVAPPADNAKRSGRTATPPLNSSDAGRIDGLFERPLAARAPQQLDAPSTQPTQESPGPRGRQDPDAPAPLVGRGLAALAQQRGGTLSMRLDPPSLGDVRITMTIRQGSVTADIMPSTAVAQEFLGADIASLKSALERQGLVVDRVTVHTPPPTGRAESLAAHQSAGDPRDSSRQGSDGQERSDRQQSFRHDAGGGSSRGRGDRSGSEQRSGTGSEQHRSRRFQSFGKVWDDVSDR